MAMKKYIGLFAALAVLAGAYALAAKPIGTPEAKAPLLAIFWNTNPSSCSFRHLTGSIYFRDTGQDGLDIEMVRLGSTEVTVVDSVSTTDDVKPRLLEYLIRVNGLPLTPDDFRDPTTGEFDCTNDKLLSLL
jgi:hypothetical protein